MLRDATGQPHLQPDQRSDCSTNESGYNNGSKPAPESAPNFNNGSKPANAAAESGSNNSSKSAPESASDFAPNAAPKSAPYDTISDIDALDVTTYHSAFVESYTSPHYDTAYACSYIHLPSR